MSQLILPRRKFLAGLVGLIAAPAIVRAASLMPVKAINPGITIHTINVAYDDGYSTPLTWSFAVHTDDFEINPRTGVITAKRALMPETTYTLPFILHS